MRLRYDIDTALNECELSHGQDGATKVARSKERVEELELHLAQLRDCLATSDESDAAIYWTQ